MGFLFGLIWFGFMIIDYLISNPVFTCISNIWLVNTSCKYTQVNNQTVLYLTSHFRMNQQNGSKYCYVSLTIQLNITHLFEHG